MTKKQLQLTTLAATYSLAFYTAIVNAFMPIAQKYGIDFNPAPAPVDATPAKIDNTVSNFNDTYDRIIANTFWALSQEQLESIYKANTRDGNGGDEYVSRLSRFYITPATTNFIADLDFKNGVSFGKIIKIDGVEINTDFMNYLFEKIPSFSYLYGTPRAFAKLAHNNRCGRALVYTIEMNFCLYANTPDKLRSLIEQYPDVAKAFYTNGYSIDEAGAAKLDKLPATCGMFSSKKDTFLAKFKAVYEEMTTNTPPTPPTPAQPAPATPPVNVDASTLKKSANLFVNYHGNNCVIKARVNTPPPTKNFYLPGLDDVHIAGIKNALQSTPNKKAAAFFAKFYNLINIRSVRKSLGSTAGLYNPINSSISFNVSSDAQNNYRVFFHEGAHNIDDLVLLEPQKIHYGISNLDNRFAGAIAQDGARLEAFYKARGVKAIQKAAKYDFNPPEYSGDGFCRNVGYNLPLLAIKNQTTLRKIDTLEFFAELMSYAIAAPEWYEILKVALPRTVARFEELLDIFNPDGVDEPTAAVDTDKPLADFLNARASEFKARASELNARASEKAPAINTAFELFGVYVAHCWGYNSNKTYLVKVIKRSEKTVTFQILNTDHFTKPRHIVLRDGIETCTVEGKRTSFHGYMATANDYVSLPEKPSTPATPAPETPAPVNAPNDAPEITPPPVTTATVNASEPAPTPSDKPTPAVDTAALIGEDWHERDLPQLLHPCFGKLKFDASKVTVKHIDAAAGLTAHDFTSIISGQCLVHAITDKQFYISTRVQSLAGDTLTLRHYQFSGGTRAPLIFAIDDFDTAGHGSFVEFYINGEITVVHFNTTLVPVKTPAHFDASVKSPAAGMTLLQAIKSINVGETLTLVSTTQRDLFLEITAIDNHRFSVFSKRPRIDVTCRFSRYYNDSSYDYFLDYVEGGFCPLDKERPGLESFARECLKSHYAPAEDSWEFHAPLKR